MTINDYCKEWRRAQGITLQAIAELAGTTIGNVSNFELGRYCSGRTIAAYIVAGMEIRQPSPITIKND